MKKILSSLLAGVMACVLAVACFACNAGDQSDNKTEYFNEYNMYLVYAASENITPLDYKTWLATVKGEKGDKGEDGKSAYQIWLDNGNTGSESDFLEWLRASGVKGKSAYETFKEYYPDYKGTEQEWITAVASGDKCSLFGHSFDDGVITKEPTKGEDGVKTYTCKICKITKTEVIPKIEVAEAEIYEVEGKKYVNYGSYPQTHVSNSALIEELNKLIETNEKGYYAYNGKEYAKITAKPYRTVESSSDKYGNPVYCTYSDGTKLYSDKTEWFVVEPIKWRILEENEGSVKVVSTMILDSSCYYVNEYYRNIDGVDIAPNNYKYSTLRGFLNNGFYNAAFTTAQQNAILITDVDNSVNTTGYSSNQYACENTQDKVFALSYSEAFNSSYFASNAERQLKVTDYAKAIGAWFGTDDYKNVGSWWLRSPYYRYDNFAYLVRGGGSIAYGDGVGETYYGVVPALQISLG